MHSEDPVKDKIKEQLTVFDLAHTDGRSRVSCPNPDCPGRYKQKEECQIYSDGSGFKCYICKTSGDVFTWEQLSRGVNYAEARRTLARLVGVELAPSKERTELLTKVVREAHKYLFEDHPEKLEYLLGRGLDKTVLWQLGVGYIDMDHQVLKKSGVTRDQLAHLGLIYKSNRPGEKDKSVMAGRFVFPIKDTRGRLVQLKGRADPQVLDDYTVGKKKMIPLKAEPEGSPWGKVSNQDYLFLEDRIVEAKRAGYAILNEGEPDTATARSLDLHSFGLQGSEGLGKHAHKFKGVKRIYVMLDNDAATQFTIIKELYDLQVALPEETVYNVTIPALLGTEEDGSAKKVDVNDLKSKFGWTKDDVTSLLRQAPEARDLIVEAWGPLYKDLHIRSKLARLIVATTNPKKKDAMISRLAEITGKSVDALTFAMDPEYHDKVTSLTT